MRVAGNGGFAGAVLDAGCGSGEHALLAASAGLSVLGVDVAETALAMARQKAEERGIEAEFAVADALHLERLGRTFDTVLDCGLFHTFNAEERPGYVASLASVTEQGGTLYVLCFASATWVWISARIRSARKTCGRRSVPAAGGRSLPSDRIRLRRYSIQVGWRLGS